MALAVSTSRALVGGRSSCALPPGKIGAVRRVEGTIHPQNYGAVKARSTMPFHTRFNTIALTRSVFRN